MSRYLGRKAMLMGAISIAVASFSIIIWLLSFQRSIIYSPQSYTAQQEQHVLTKYGFDKEDQVAITLTSEDKTKLRAYWIPYSDASLVGQVPTIVYLHGNMGKIEWGLSSSVGWRNHMKVNFLIISYRGFGRSDGSPDYKGVRMDSQAALDYVLGLDSINKDKIVVYGHSLGCSVALHLANDNPDKIKAVIVENPFIRLSRVTFGNSFMSEMMEPLFTDHWNNDVQLSQLMSRSQTGAPTPHLLFLAGAKDRMIPVWHTHHLWDHMEAVCPASQRSIITKKHIFDHGRHACFDQPDYHHHIKSFLEEVFNETL